MYRRGYVSVIMLNAGPWAHGTIALTLHRAPVAVVDSEDREEQSADLLTGMERRHRMNFQIEHPVRPVLQKKRRIRQQRVRRETDRQAPMAAGAPQDPMGPGEVPILQDPMEVRHRVGEAPVRRAAEIVLAEVRHLVDQMAATVQEDREAVPTQPVQRGRMDQAAQTVPGGQMEAMVPAAVLHPAAQTEAMVPRETDRMGVQPALRHRRAPASVALVSSAVGR